MTQRRLFNIVLALLAWAGCVGTSAQARSAWAWFSWQALAWVSGFGVGHEVGLVWWDYKQTRRIMQERGAVYWEE